MSGGVDARRGAKRQPMRSSIACLRCRKSKIKCDNDGGGTAPCEGCLKNGKDCTYPEVSAPLPPKRPDPPIVAKAEPGSDRKRLKKFDEMTRLETQYTPSMLADEVLSAQYLTEALWLNLFDLYRQHFWTELPFLHLATLKERMGSKFRARQKDTPSSPEVNLILLGILTLTARFHKELPKYVAHQAQAQQGGAKARVKADPAAASEYYADALTKALGTLKPCMSDASVEKVQAFLMLGLYEWNQAGPQTGGMTAWMYVGTAIRMAQALGLGFGDTDDDDPRIEPRQLSSSPSHDVTAKEIRRRTMFSCLILDRMLACGKRRESIIRSANLQIQLPCSETGFDMSIASFTGFLTPDRSGKLARPIANDSVLGNFLRLVDIWGKISEFSYAGGRLREEVPPWDERSTFRRLREELEVFYASLPDIFTLSTSNYDKHENHAASNCIYVSMHILGSLCRIMLHREYVPFIPIRCDGPVGPLDPPVFTDAPEGFWTESAEWIFKAAREIVELLQICGNKLPMSALVLFAVWTAAFVGIYAFHFPHLDTHSHMLDEETMERLKAGQEVDLSNSVYAQEAFSALLRMSSTLRMAGTYATYFKEIDQYYSKIKHDYARTQGKLQHPAQAQAQAQSGDGKLSIRLGSGGGLDEWKVHSGKIVDFSTISSAEKPRQYDESDRETSVSVDRSDRARTPRSTPSMTFTPINSAMGGASAPPSAQHDPHGSGGPRHEGLSEANGNGGWRGYSAAPTQHPMQDSPTQHYQSLPAHGTEAGGDDHPVAPTLGPFYEGNDVMKYIIKNEGNWGTSVWNVDSLAHGYPAQFILSPEQTLLLQQVGTYE